jgi:hypothetical protein
VTEKGPVSVSEVLGKSKPSILPGPSARLSAQLLPVGTTSTPAHHHGCTARGNRSGQRHTLDEVKADFNDLWNITY